MKKTLYVTLNYKKTLSFSVTAFMFLALVGMMLVPAFHSESVSATADEFPIIIVDAGHGGEDGGTQAADGTLEKDINLELSLKINSILHDKGIRTVMIREEDCMIYDDSATSQREKKVSDIHNRLKVVEDNGNCILLSIHQNYFTDSKYSGTQVFYSKNNSDSKLLAEEIQKNVVFRLQPDNTRQIKESGTNIYLLYHAMVPSVMVECGFMSNKAEAEKLKSEEYQTKMAQAIVEGLLNYIERNPEGDKNNGSENKKYFRLQ